MPTTVCGFLFGAAPPEKRQRTSLFDFLDGLVLLGLFLGASPFPSPVVSVMIERLETDAVRYNKNNRPLLHQKRRHRLKKRPGSVVIFGILPYGKITMTLCTAAHSSPCTATSQQVRLACLHCVPRHSTCSSTGSSLQAQSCERVANSADCPCTNRIDHVALDRSSCASSFCCWDTLSSPHACFLTPSLWFWRAKAPHVMSQESMVVGRAFAESQAPLKVSDQKLPVKAPLFSPTLPWASWSECLRV